jgi:phage tail tube protein FII
VATDNPKTPIPFDPTALIDAQRRNFEAFTNAGQIVADSMRTVAERQAAMVQEAMQGLWGEMRSAGSGTAKPAQAADQAERMRAAFEKVMTQVQEMSGVLMQAQAEAMTVLNGCAAANMEQFGKMAPDLAALQRAATDAVQAATTQVSAAVEEMRKRMTELEGQTRQATGAAMAGGSGGEARGGTAAVVGASAAAVREGKKGPSAAT